MQSLKRSRLLPVLFRSKVPTAQDADFKDGDYDPQGQDVLPDGVGRMRLNAKRIDPAPSRWSYRLQRWMLTPGIRLGLRIGVPFCLAFVIGSAFLSNEKRRDALNMFVADVRASIQDRPEFMVNLMAIDGAGDSLAADIREVVPFDFPTSSFDLDVEQIRDIVAGLDPVKSATVRIRPGGILQVDVVERLPVVVWRTREGLELLDETGAHVDDLKSRKERGDLPLIVGDAADKAVDEAMALLHAAQPLGDRLRGLARMGERRWDVVLDRGQRILLPSERPVRALERVLAVNEVQELLDRDVAVVDMRIGSRPTIRMTENATEEWWRIRKASGNGQ